jgi:hypothetical protein
VQREEEVSFLFFLLDAGLVQGGRFVTVAPDAPRR